MALKKTYTIGDSVYEQLLEEILTLQYLPGEKLSEILLAETASAAPRCATPWDGWSRTAWCASNRSPAPL